MLATIGSIRVPTHSALCVKVGLWDVQASTPAVRNVPVFEDGAVMCPLEDAMPLRALIAPLDTFSSQLAAAVDMLQPAPACGRLALGSIINAVLDYLACFSAILRHLITSVEHVSALKSVLASHAKVNRSIRTRSSTASDSS
jgi:hypothetical protein